MDAGFNFTDENNDELSEYMMLAQGFIMTLITRVLIMIKDGSEGKTEDTVRLQQASAITSIMYSVIVNLFISISASDQMALGLIETVVELLKDNAQQSIKDHGLVRNVSARRFWSDVSSSFANVRSLIDNEAIVSQATRTLLDMEGSNVDVYDLLASVVSSLGMASILLADEVDESKEANETEEIEGGAMLVAVIAATINPAIKASVKKVVEVVYQST